MGDLGPFSETREVKVEGGQRQASQPTLTSQASLHPTALPEVIGRHPRQDGTKVQIIKDVKQVHHRAGRDVKEISRRSITSQEAGQGPGSLTPRKRRH